MAYNDDAKMKLLQEAWKKMDEEGSYNPGGDVTYNAHPGKPDMAEKRATEIKATGTAKNVRQPLAEIGDGMPAGTANLAEEEGEDTGTPASAEDIGGGEAPAGDASAAMGGDMTDPMAAGGAEAGMGGSPWDQLVAGMDQVAAALKAIAAEEKGEPAHGADAGMGADAGAAGPMGADAGAGAGEPDVTDVAEQYLEEAKKKLEEKRKGKAAVGDKSMKGRTKPPFEPKGSVRK